MPFYDLHCPVCREDFNIAASMADKKNKRVPCPQCGSMDLETVYKAGPAYIRSKTSGKAPGAAECPNRRYCGGGCQYAG